MNTVLKISMKMDKYGFFTDTPNYQSCITRLKKSRKGIAKSRTKYMEKIKSQPQ